MRARGAFKIYILGIEICLSADRKDSLWRENLMV